MEVASEKPQKDSGSRWGDRFLNAALLGLGLLTLVLLYALATRTIMPRVDPTREANPSQLVGEILQVEVRNGCGVDGVAGTTTRFLRRQGFDVVEVGDHVRFDEPRSLIIDRVGDLAAARKIARALGIEDDAIVQDLRSDLFLDATVVIGKDFATLKPFLEK